VSFVWPYSENTAGVREIAESRLGEIFPTIMSPGFTGVILIIPLIEIPESVFAHVQCLCCLLF
jgi:hypothetical protein